MKAFYIRWGIVLCCLAVVALLGIERYGREVVTILPAQLLQKPSASVARVSGMVRAGSLIRSPGLAPVFELMQDEISLAVRYVGPPNDNLREIKTLVVVGRWDPRAREFVAEEIRVVPNYGFVTSAYLVGVLSILIFLFTMERRMRLLSAEIREETVYQSEEHIDTPKNPTI